MKVFFKSRRLLIALCATSLTACSQIAPPKHLDSTNTNLSSGKKSETQTKPPVDRPAPDKPTTDKPIVQGGSPSKTYIVSMFQDAAKKAYGLLKIKPVTDGNRTIKQGTELKCVYTSTAKPEDQYQCEFDFDTLTGAIVGEPKTTVTAEAEDLVNEEKEYFGPLRVELKNSFAEFWVNSELSLKLYESLQFKPVELAATDKFNTAYVKNGYQMECGTTHPKGGALTHTCKVRFNFETGAVLVSPFYSGKPL